ncbi:PAS-domain containing protein [Rubellimicrobium arenae]|uniref:PAS-domain containing protein n=1 Tax=Rubellimicrobium arenae TaxID=2817372 RepID=UPI001B30E3E7
MLHALNILGAGLSAFVGASAIVFGLDRWTDAAPVRSLSAGGAVIFLFEGGTLVDATPAARQLLRGKRRADSDLSRLADVVGGRFGTVLTHRLSELRANGRLILTSIDGLETLEAEEENGLLRLTLRTDCRSVGSVDRLSVDALEAELLLLRGLAEDAPLPIWTQDSQDQLSWANRAYLELSDRNRVAPDDPAQAEGGRSFWPAAPLFEPPRDLNEGECRQRRLSLPRPVGESPVWYEVTSVRRGEGSLHFANDVSGLVLAESARQHFVQTLAKTFASLRTGLAIFDRDRRLVLFNPAFVDLTGLPIGFLSGRPVVQTVLDRLREAKILPEPRDYAGWRDEVAALEAAAAQGQYCENWSLPNGQIYRVTGRPHPDGAVAFLFEDISDEIGLTRRFRAELSLARNALDALDDAVAAFSPTGDLTLWNMAYARLWRRTEGTTDPGHLQAEAAEWERACLPTPFWAQLHARSDSARVPLETALEHRDGRRLRVRLVTLTGGGLLAMFREDPEHRLGPTQVAS